MERFGARLMLIRRLADVSSTLTKTLSIAVRPFDNAASSSMRFESDLDPGSCTYPSIFVMGGRNFWFVFAPVSSATSTAGSAKKYESVFMVSIPTTAPLSALFACITKSACNTKGSGASSTIAQQMLKDHRRLFAYSSTYSSPKADQGSATEMVCSPRVAAGIAEVATCPLHRRPSRAACNCLSALYESLLPVTRKDGETSVGSNLLGGSTVFRAASPH